MTSKSQSFETWDEHDLEAWAPAGPVIGIAASVLVSAMAWIVLVGVAAEFLG